MPRKKKKQIVEVSWVDPTIEAGWVENHTHDEPLTIMKSYGVLISRGPKLVTIGGTYDQANDGYADRTKFPIGCVTKITILGDVEPLPPQPKPKARAGKRRLK